jgi:hypothetical protein
MPSWRKADNLQRGIPTDDQSSKVMQPGKEPFDLPTACERQNQWRSLKEGRLWPQEWGAKQNLLFEQSLAQSIAVMSLSAMMYSGFCSPARFFRVASASFTPKAQQLLYGSQLERA